MKKTGTDAPIPLRKLFLFALILLVQWLSPSSLLAQDNIITGTVLNTNGEPVQGASISVKGANIHAVTDVAGKFTIKASPQNILVISHVSYVTIEDKFDGSRPLQITLQAKAAELNNVVVIGYGTQKKADLTGAIVTVSGTELNKRVVTNPTQLLQGKLPGSPSHRPREKPATKDLSFG